MIARAGAVRAAVGVSVGLVVAGGLTVAALAPWPAQERSALDVTVTPDTARSVVVCDGPLLALGRDQSAAGAISIAGEAPVVVGSGGTAAEAVPLRAPDRIDAGTFDGAYVAPPTDGRLTELAAASSATAEAADLRGLAASACTPPLMESWLATGSATTGTSDIILLANPGDVAASVDLRVFGAAGADDPAPGQNLVVAPRTQRAIPLASVAPGEESPVVRVTADGAPVRASIQSSLTRGLVPAGLDRAAAAAAPSASLVIPAVEVAVAPGTSASAGGLVVRLLAADQQSRADVVVRSVDTGAVVAEQQDVELPAGQPLALDVTGMPVGTYTVSIEADAPVVVAARSETDEAAPADFGWAVAASAFDAPTLAAIAAGPSPSLTITADGAATVTVAPLSGGEAQTVELGDGQARSLAVAAGETYRIDPAGASVRASVTFAGAGQLASYPVSGSAAAAAEIVVYP